jgi:hypothetical protein
MAPRERSCRQCSGRFAPTRFDQAYCQDCSRRLRDAHLIEDAMFGSPHQSIDRIAISTGLSIERIRELATEGALAAIPVGADMPTECVCPPGVYGRCAHCRSQLALRFAEASYQAAKLADNAKSGMRMRDGGRVRRHS